MNRTVIVLVVCLFLSFETWKPKRPTSFGQVEPSHVRVHNTTHTEALVPVCVRSGSQPLFPVYLLDEVDKQHPSCMVCPTETALPLRPKDINNSACLNFTEGCPLFKVYSLVKITYDDYFIEFRGSLLDYVDVRKFDNFFTSPSATYLVQKQVDIFCHAHGHQFNLRNKIAVKNRRHAMSNESDVYSGVLDYFTVFWLSLNIHSAVSPCDSTYIAVYLMNHIVFTLCMIHYALIAVKWRDTSPLVSYILCGVSATWITSYYTVSGTVFEVVYGYIRGIVITVLFDTSVVHYSTLFTFVNFNRTVFLLLVIATGLPLTVCAFFTFFGRRFIINMPQGRPSDMDDPWYYDVPCQKTNQDGQQVFWFKRYYNDGTVYQTKKANSYAEADFLRGCKVEQAGILEINSYVVDLGFINCVTPYSFCKVISIIANLYKFHEARCPVSVYITYIATNLFEIIGPRLINFNYMSFLERIKAVLLSDGQVEDDGDDSWKNVKNRFGQDKVFSMSAYKREQQPIVQQHANPNVKYEPSFMSKLLTIGGCIFAIATMPSWASFGAVERHLQVNRFSQISNSCLNIYDLIAKFCEYSACVCSSLAHCFLTNEWNSTLFGAGKFRKEFVNLRLCHENLYQLTAQDDCVTLPYSNIFSYEVALLRAIEQCKDPVIMPALERENMLRELESFKRSLDFERLNGSPRKAPWSAVVYGDSGIGKSSITDLLFTIVARVYELPIGKHSKEYVYTHNAASKYWDTCRSHHWGYLFDDMACEKPNLLSGDHNSNSPLLHVLNVTPVCAVHADVSLKGKIACRPRCAIITTNNKTLNAPHTSAFPSAILRRPVCFIEPKPIPEVCQPNTTQVDSEKFAAHVEEFGLGFQWKWNVEKCNTVQSLDPSQPSYRFSAIMYNGVQLRDVDFEVFSDWIVHSLHTHDEQQGNVVKTMRTLSSKIHFCKCNKKITREPCGTCYKEHHGLVSHTKTLFISLWSRIKSYLAYKPPFWRLLITELIVEKTGDCRGGMDYTNGKLLDEDFLSLLAHENHVSIRFNDGVTIGHYATIIDVPYNYPLSYTKRRDDTLLWLLRIIPFFPIIIVFVLDQRLVSFLVGCIITTIVIKYKTFNTMLVTWYASSWVSSRRMKAKHLLWVAGLLGVIYLSISRVKSYFVEQGLAQSVPAKNMEPCEKQDWWSLNKTNYFTPCAQTQQISTNVVGTANYDAFRRLCATNTFFVDFFSGDVRYMGMYAFAIDGNHLLFPHHAVRDRNCDKIVIYSLHNGDKQMHCSVAYNPNMAYICEHDDLVLFRCARSLNRRNLVNYIPSEKDGAPRDTSVYHARSNKFVDTGVATSIEFTADCDEAYWEKPYLGTRTPLGASTFAGRFWSTRRNLDLYECGDCGNVLISSEGKGAILAIHCGVVYEQSRGIFYNTTQRRFAYGPMITREWVLEGMNYITQGLDFPATEPRVIHSANIINHKCEHGGIDLTSVKPVHPDAIANKFDSRIGQPICALSRYFPEKKSRMRIYKQAPLFAKYGITCSKFVPPMGRDMSRTSYSIAVEEINNVREDLPYSELITCAKHYISSVLQNLDRVDPKWKCKIGKLNFSEVVHGIDDRLFIDHLNYNTSAGFPWYETKSKLGFSKESGEKHPEWMEERVALLELNYINGMRNNPVFCAHLKDEMISEKKIKLGKLRVFVGSPVDFTILLRMYFLSMIALMQTHKFIFETAISIAAQKIDWTYLFQHMTSDRNFSRHIDGDYKAFDKSMHQFVVALACTVFMSFIRESGSYSQCEICAMHLMLQDVYDTLVDFDGTLVYIAGSNPSGHPLTVIINGIVNSIYIRLAYYRKFGNLLHFSEEIKIVTYGDDNWIATKQDCDFKHSDIVENLKDVVQYTSAEKDGNSYDYKNVEDITFLKRRFILNAELSELLQRPIYLGPLEKESIYNMLVCGGNDNLQSIVLVESISSALNEIALHGKDEFDKLCAICVSVLEECGFINYEFKNYYQTLGTFFPQLLDIESYLAKCGMVRGSIFNASSKEYVATQQMGLVGGTPQTREMSANFVNFNSTTDAREYAQAGDTTASHTGDLIGPIGQAFRRDVKIGTYSITEGSNFTHVLYPWELYGANPYIKDKMRNYSKFKADLVLTFVMNSNPFRYGAIIASYKPLTTPVASVPTSDIEYMDNSGGVIDQTYIDASNYPIITGASRIQRDHVMLYPQETERATMKIPFYHFNNYLPLVGTDLENQVALRTLGRLVINTLMPLKTATTASLDPITIDVFAHLENYDICGPSIQRQGDEYDPDLPVSSTASAVASAAAKLSSIPIIGWYATATSVIATSVANVARWFGFSNPVNVTNVNPFKLVRMTRWADSEAMQPLAKLALDPKNEISIDGRLVGCSNSDDMNIDTICAKPFLLGITTWSALDGVDTIIQEGLVTPIEFHKTTFAPWNTETAVGSFRSFTMSPTTWVGQTFTHWSGDLEITFKILATKFHKGRLRFVFDPAGKFSTYKEGCVFSELFEIKDDNEYTVTIPWQSIKPVLDILPLTAGATTDQFFAERGSISTTGADMYPYVAGFWRLQVMTALSSPLDADAFVMTTTRWRNVRMFKPRDPFPASVWQYSAPVTISRQGKSYVVPAKGNDNEVLPLIVGGETCLSIRQLLHRWCLTSIYSSTFFDVNTIAQSFVMSLRRFPLFHGPCKSSPIASSGGAVAAACRFGNTPLNYFTPAYMLRRGAIHWRFDPLCVEDTAGINNNWRTVSTIRDMIVSQSVETGLPTTSTTESNPQLTTITNSNYDSLRDGWVRLGWQGCEIARDSQQGLEVACPDYFSGKGRSCNQYVCNQSNGYSQMVCESNTTNPSLDNLTIKGQVVPPNLGVTSTTRSARVVVTSYCCAGADYSLHKFINVPTIYIGASDP